MNRIKFEEYLFRKRLIRINYQGSVVRRYVVSHDVLPLTMKFYSPSLVHVGEGLFTRRLS